MMNLTTRLLTAVALVALVTACAGGTPRGPAPAPFARAELRMADGTQVGDVRFFDQAGATIVRVSVRVPTGATAVGTFHGFHIHANDAPANGEGCVADPNADPAQWFVSADGHLRDDTQVHPDHLGDLAPVLITRDGTASIELLTDRLTRENVIGRAAILHEDPDNLGNIPLGDGPEQYRANSPAALTLTDDTGNAGIRIACGVIG